MINPTPPSTSNIDTTIFAPSSSTTAESGNVHHSSSASFASSGSSCSNNSSNIHNEDDNSGISSYNLSIHSGLIKRGPSTTEPYHRNAATSLESIQFQDDLNLLQ